MRERLERLRVFSGIDFHVGLTLLLRSWGVVAGVLMLLGVSYWLSAQQQGYYFTFASLLSLQIFFELGFSQVIVQLVSRELAHVSAMLPGTYKNDRLASIIALTRRWYRIAAILFALVAGAAGVLLFGRSGMLSQDLWLGPWLLLVLTTAVNIYFSPFLAIIEGAGQIGQVARLRLVQSVLGYCLTWMALYAGAGLWSVVLVPFVAVLSGIYWLRKGEHIVKELRHSTADATRNPVIWKTEVLPFQWRIAVSWVSGYLMFQLFTPLVFYFEGSVAAGQLGMGMAVFNAVLSVGASWVNAKIPAFTMLIVRRERQQLNALFKNVASRSVVFTLMASVTLLLIVYALKAFAVPNLDRLASLPILFSLAVVTVVNTFVYAAASYMRAHGEEPMLPVSIIGAIGTLLIIFVFLNFSVELTMIAYAGFTATISGVWTLRLFLSYYRRAD